MLTIENAGHDLFFSHGKVIESIATFLEGTALETYHLEAPLPDFAGD
jgi:hypothetical protein